MKNEAITVESVILHCIFVVGGLGLFGCALLEEDFTLILDGLAGFAAKKVFYFAYGYDIFTEDVVDMAKS